MNKRESLPKIAKMPESTIRKKDSIVRISKQFDREM